MKSCIRNSLQIFALAATLYCPILTQAESHCQDALKANFADPSLNPRQLMNGLSERFARKFDQELFLKLQGQIRKEARQNPKVDAAIKNLESEAVDLYIYSNVPPKIVSQVGLLNVRGPQDRGDLISLRRDFVEAIAMQLPIQDYANIPNQMKPKYGLLVPRGVRPADPGYGKFAYKINVAKVRDRLTFSIAGDSRNRIQSDLDLPSDFDGEFRLSKQENVIFPIENWSYMFVPWSYRILLTHSLVSGTGKPEFSLNQEWRDPLFPTFTRSREYIEVQIFDELSPDTIEIQK